MKYVFKMMTMVVLLSSLFPFQCFAAEMNVVTSETTAVGPNCEIRIPVMIKNNQGIIGFRITVEYDESQISITDVYKGNVTDKGLFNNNVNMASESFDVLWSYTEDISENGTLFEIVGKTTEDLQDDVIIEISYSQEDTFNENMEDVVLQCKDVILTYDAEKKDTVLEDDIQLSSDAQEYVDNAICDVDAQVIVDTVDGVMGEYDIDDIEQASEEEMKKISDEVVVELEEKGVSSELLTDEEDKILAVKELYQVSKGNAEINKENSINVGKQVEKVDTNVSNKIDMKIIISLVVGILLVVGVIFVLVRKKGK